MVGLVLSLASGVLLAWSLPPFDQEWLGWVALVPLLFAATRSRPLEAVGLGLVAGLVAGGVHARWHANVSALHYAYVPFFWMTLLLAGVVGAASIAHPRMEGATWALFVAAVGVMGEWLTALLPLPVNLALCQHRTVTVIQVAAVTGIWGVSFLLWGVNALLADRWLRTAARRSNVQGVDVPPLQGGEDSPTWIQGFYPWLITSAPSGRGSCAGAPSGRGGRAWRAALLVTGLGALLLVGGGAAVLRGNEGGRRIVVAAVQEHSGGESSGVLEPGMLAAEGDREALTRGAVGRGARLVVWSEGCLGNAFAPEDPRDETTALARELGAHMVVGYSEPGSPKGYNCAALVTPGGGVAGAHRKIHLFLGERNAVKPGIEALPVATELGPVGMEICFDTCYTGVTRKLAGRGARLIAVPNYDPPTPRGVLQRLHAAVLPFRAVENHVPIVRADPNGCSQVIDARGRILAQGGLFRPEAVVAEVALGDGRGTPYSRLGDWFAHLCAAVVGMMGLGLLLRGRHRAPHVAERSAEP